MLVYLHWQRRQRCPKSATSRKYLFFCLVALFRSRDLFVTSEVIDCESHPSPILCILRIWTYYVSFAKFGIATPPSGGRGLKPASFVIYIPPQLGDALPWGPQMMVLYDGPQTLRAAQQLFSSRANDATIVQTHQWLYKPTDNCTNDATWQLFVVNSAAERLSVLSGRITQAGGERVIT